MPLIERSFVLVALLLICAVIAMCLAPLAGVVCWWIARSKGWPRAPWVVQGACSFAALAGPWFYLLLRMYDVRTPRRVVYAVYGTLYMAWIVGPIQYMALGLHQVASSRIGALEIVWGVLLGLNVLTWFWSQGLLRKQASQPTGNSSAGILAVVETTVFGPSSGAKHGISAPSAVFLLPSALVIGWSLMCIVMLGSYAMQWGPSWSG